MVNGTLGVVLLAGAGLSYVSIRGDGPSPATPPTTRVARGTVLATVSASGSVTSADTRDLSFATSGTVEKIEVEVGEKVKKGQVLARLDDESARDNLDAARASLDAAEAADTSTAQGESALVSAQVAYDNAKRQLDGTVLKAPFDGTIIAINGTVGSGSSGGLAASAGGSPGSSDGSSGRSSGGSSSGGSAGSTSNDTSSGGGSGFMTIADPSKLEIETDFSEADVTKLKVGQAAMVRFDALPGTQVQGEVTAIDPSSHTSNNVVQYGVTVALHDVPGDVRLGQTATVEVVTGKADDTLYVPSSAVSTAGGQTTVRVLQDGRQVIRRVQVGVEGDQTTEIVSGLNEGDQVVLSNGGTNGGFPGGGFPGRGGALGGGLVGRPSAADGGGGR